MKLRNKKTGEIIDIYKGQVLLHYDGGKKTIYFKSFEELEDWENYEEPKGTALDFMVLTLTNFIENEPDAGKVDLEDCKQMLSKLKAWKRLKDKGFRFVGVRKIGKVIDFDIPMRYYRDCLSKFNEDGLKLTDDLNLLFGGEE